MRVVRILVVCAVILTAVSPAWAEGRAAAADRGWRAASGFWQVLADPFVALFDEASEILLGDPDAPSDAASTPPPRPDTTPGDADGVSG
jgi:hypothetical protein